MSTGVSTPIGIFLVTGAAGGNVPLFPGGWTPYPLTNGDASPITKGQVCYMSAADTARIAQSDGTEAQATAVCICIDDSVAPGDVGKFVFGGAVPDIAAGKTPITPGYLSATSGVIATAPNLAGGQYNVILGYWLNATDFQFNPQIPILN